MKPTRQQLAQYLGICGVSLCALLLAGVPAQSHEGHDNLSSTGVTVRGNRLILSPTAEKSLGIQTQVVKLRDLERDITANSGVEVPWRQHAYASSLVAGKVAQLLVQPGDSVEAGQVIAQVESQDIETLQLDLLKAATGLDLANRLLGQQTSLAASGSISDRRVLESESNRDRFAAERGIGVRKLLSLGLSKDAVDGLLATGNPIRMVPITSPIHGVISEVNVSAGQVVAPWQQIGEIVDQSRIWIHGQVLETESALVAEGQPVEFKVDALPDQKFTGVLDHVGVKLDPESRSVHVHVDIDNPDGLLKQGMFGRLRIRATLVQQAVACPRDALIDVGREPWVLVQQRAGVYERQPVKLGMRSGPYVEILDGIFPGDPVVVTGKQELASLFAARESAPTVAKDPSSFKRPAVAAGTAAGVPRTIVAQAQIELPTAMKARAFSTVTGRIAHVLVEHGEAVRAGQVLAEVESLELRTVQLDLLQAQTRLKLSRMLLARYDRLSERGGITQKDLWQVQADTENLQVTVASLRNRLSLMGLSPEEIDALEQVDIAEGKHDDAIRTTSEIRAPIDGRITVFDLSIGQVVRPQDELFEIHDVSRVVVRGYVHEQDMADVRVGEAATVTITADPSFSAQGVISRAAPTLSTWGRAMSVWVELDNSGGALKEGMLARLAIETTAGATAARKVRPAQTAASTTPTAE